MSAGKWTLGPWTFREPNGRGMGYEIREIGAWFGRDTLSAQTLANVQLCTAAPELLEALEELNSLLDRACKSQALAHDVIPASVVRSYRAAIAKARGEK